MDSQYADKRLISYHSKLLHANASEVLTGFNAPLPHVLDSSLQSIQGKMLRMLLWYRLPDQNISDRLDMKFKTMANALLYRRNNGAVIIVATEERADHEAKNMPNDLKKFMATLIPHLYGQPL